MYMQADKFLRSSIDLCLSHMYHIVRHFSELALINSSRGCRTESYLNHPLQHRTAWL
jgi:hypothetical protein